MTAKSPQIIQVRKRTRTATVTYPYNPLATCLVVAKGVSEIGNGKQAVSRSMLASHLNLDEKSGDFAQKLASTKCYGLIDGRSDFKLTELAQSYFFPTQDPEREKRVALIQACGAPGAFSELLNRYDGSKLPASDLIGNVLSREFGIPESWKFRIASFFVKALTTAGTLSQDGFIRHKSELQKLTSGHGPHRESESKGSGHKQNQEKDEGTRQDGQRDRLPADTGDRGKVVIWTYRFEGKSFHIETPEDITTELCDKLKRYIDVLNPNP